VNVTSTTAPVRAGHVGLNVVDLQRSVSFYTQVLGLTVLAESSDDGRRFAFLGADGEPLITLWEQSEGGFDKGLAGLHHLAFEVADIMAVRRAESRLRELGVRFHYNGIVRHSTHSHSAGVFFEDPDGIRLEIFAPGGDDALLAPTQSSPACGFF
jgi:catechol-2,3-dioxygenase